MRKRSRDVRQEAVSRWVHETFGASHATSIKQRAIRLLEEAIEAYQSAGCDAPMAHSLVDHVFSNPPGLLRQEIGGVGTTLLALAESVGVSADEEEERELDRVRSKTAEHFRVRNEAKNAAGFYAVD